MSLSLSLSQYSSSKRLINHKFDWSISTIKKSITLSSSSSLFYSNRYNFSHSSSTPSSFYLQTGYNLPTKVKIVEVGPRDGLQNEPESSQMSESFKVEFVNRLSETGLRHIETGAFVSPKWVPQMASSLQVFQNINRKSGVVYSALVPNVKGLEAALSARVNEIAVFAAASESFSKKNINCSIKESIERFIPVIEKAKSSNIPIRGYVSCVLGCPYEGEITPSQVQQVAKELYDLGCHEISLGDTIGVGTPSKCLRMLQSVSDVVPLSHLAVHMHDTYGQALANVLASLQFGVSIIDSSIGGLGGCPYAKGASGNLATEDVCYMLNGLGIQTHVNFERLLQVSKWLSEQLNRKPTSRVALALHGH